MWLLDWGRRALETFDRVVLALERELLAAEELLDDLNGLLQALDSGRRRVVGNSRLLVVGNQPAGAEAELEPAVGEEVDGGRLLGEHDRMPVVVVEDKRPDRSFVVASAAAMRAAIGPGCSPKWSGRYSVENPIDSSGAGAVPPLAARCAPGAPGRRTETAWACSSGWRVAAGRYHPSPSRLGNGPIAAAAAPPVQ